jgi:hypothetical protein
MHMHMCMVHVLLLVKWDVLYVSWEILRGFGPGHAECWTNIMGVAFDGMYMVHGTTLGGETMQIVVLRRPLPTCFIMYLGHASNCSPLHGPMRDSVL